MTRSTDSRPSSKPSLERGREVETPAALPAMWRLVKLGYRHEPGLIVFAAVMTIVAAVPDALLALWLKLITDGMTTRSAPLVLGGLAGVAGSMVLTWVLATVSQRVTRRFRDKVTIALEGHVAGLQARISTITHQERPDYLDRLAVLRQQTFVLDHMYMSLLSALSWIIRVVVTLALLASVHPAMLLLVIFAIPTVVSSSRRPLVERRAEEGAAVHQRLAEHLFRTATTASAAKEVRITGIGPGLVQERRREWDRWYAPVAHARNGTALWNAAGWAVFGVGFAASVWFSAIVLGATAGQVVMVVAIGARLSDYIAATVGEIGFIRGTWLDGSRRLAWLEDYAVSQAAEETAPAPLELHDGIRLQDVSFSYPGTDRLVIEQANVHLPAGTVIALVGENGAGKSTLVKLLAKYYQPDSGEVLVDGVPLRTIDGGQWRTRMAGAFQDFHRFEFMADRTVGIGDLPRIENRRAVEEAVSRAGAQDVVAVLPRGLDTQLGPNWPAGVDLSFGQWQKLALARGFMRTEPLLQVLDEPTAALDAETEHALFERYAAAARANSNGAITLLVSHRFSTVRMADLIVVLDGNRIVEVGSHADLMARNGQYAELYRIQETAYR